MKFLTLTLILLFVIAYLLLVADLRLYHIECHFEPQKCAISLWSTHGQDTP